MPRLSTQLRIGALAWGLAAVALAATALKPAPEINVSSAFGQADKAKAVNLSYLHGSLFKRAWLYTYLEGPAGHGNVYARFKFEDAADWSVPILLSRDAALQPTGGQAIVVRDGLGFTAGNGKPSIFAPPLTSGPRVMVTWDSAYCPGEPASATQSGSYANPLQGASDYDGDGTADRPYHCIWVASTIDPALTRWDVRQLTHGVRDAVNEVVAGNSTGTAFALAWQEDAAGLQPGEAEGMGDGGSGSHVTGGTNIWYTHAPAPNGDTLRANIAQLTDNNETGTGRPGASRPNLHLSGSVAAVAYEETACPGGKGGKCIVYHAFPYASHDTNSPGTIVSDVAANSRRVRFVMQGESGAEGAVLRTFLMWRQSALIEPGASADIVVRRGLVDKIARPGSNGFLPSDILADAPQNMTQVESLGGNAMAHRAVLRGSFVGLAYVLSTDRVAADPKKTPVPTANYNLMFVRSDAQGASGSWSQAVDVSRVQSPEFTVVEPRLVATPGTIVNPLTGVAEPGDAQNRDVLFMAYATQRNLVDGAPGRVYIARSKDSGLSFEPFVPVSAAPEGQSEAQIQARPDGSSAKVLWMYADSVAGTPVRLAMGTAVTAIALPDLGLAADDTTVNQGGQRTLNVVVRNGGEGTARQVVVTGQLPGSMAPVGIGLPGECTVERLAFRCTFAQLGSGQSRTISLTLGATDQGSFELNTQVSSDYLDADEGDNAATAHILATPAPVLPPTPPPVPKPTPDAVADEGGGGCSLSRGGAPVDPALPMLVMFSALGLVLRRAGAR